MVRRKIILVLALCLAAAAAQGDEQTTAILTEAWPADSVRLTTLGRGVGIVFSPDLSVKGNCRFYETLGFACFEDADWNRVLFEIHLFNRIHPDRPLRTLILETHGTNGNGLKLQESYDPAAARSYISVGALQEQLDRDRLQYAIISACNSGRLLRPSIYRTLDPNPGDKLFLPATRGILGASDEFDPVLSGVTVVTPSSSHIETTLVASVRELAPGTRRLLEQSAKRLGIEPPRDFAVSDLLMQMVLRDSRLALTTGNVVDTLSKEVGAVDVSESLYSRFARQLNRLALREAPPPAVKTKAATAKKKSAPPAAKRKTAARRP